MSDELVALKVKSLGFREEVQFEQSSHHSSLIAQRSSWQILSASSAQSASKECHAPHGKILICIICVAFSVVHN